MINVLIADDHAIFREGIGQIIALQPDMRVCGEAANGEDLLRQLRRLVSTVLLLDISMPGQSGISLIGQVKSLAPCLPILILSMHEQRQYVIQAVRSGAGGYITKASPSAEVLKGIRTVASGKMFINGTVAEQLALNLREPIERPPHTALTGRELQVFQMLVEGVRVSEIARILHLSEKTISTHKTRLQFKLGLASATELVRYAIRHGLTKDDRVL